MKKTFNTLVLAVAAAAALALPALAQNAKITAGQATIIAQQKYGGTPAQKTVLENEEGTWQYGVMLRSGDKLREVMVNANTGHIDSVEVTTAVKEKREVRAEKAHAKSGSDKNEKPGTEEKD